MTVAVLLGLGAYFLTGITTMETMPSNALLLVDDETREYFSPPCIEDVPREHVERMRAVEAVEVRFDYKPNVDCRDSAGFTGTETSLLRKIAERFGLPKKLSRWTADGDWRW